MIFTIVITGAPTTSNAPATALRFARSALNQGHKLHRVFLQGDGVHCATSLSEPPQDVLNVQQGWDQMVTEHSLDVVVCVASALKRGVIDQGEADRYNKSASNLLPSMELSGLGQLMDAIQQSDRVITFGG